MDGRHRVGTSLLAITVAVTAASCSTSGVIDGRPSTMPPDDTTKRPDASLQPDAKSEGGPDSGPHPFDASRDIASRRDGGADARIDAGAKADASAGWVLTVYFTSVQTFHGGTPQRVFGCPTNQCPSITIDLGTYPGDFVQAVHDQGTGRITEGAFAGQYLNWSIDIGYWIDVAPRDARARPLEPYVSAAADPSIPYDLPFRIVDCGTDYFGSAPIAASICNELKAARWVVRDRFTVGAVGAQLDLYIGEENTAAFAATSPKLISAKNAVIAFGP
jgi:hypothetical protein